MGLRGWLRNWALKGAVKKIKKLSTVDKSVVEMLGDELKTLTATRRTADKILKVKLIRAETQATLDRVQELQTEDEDEEDEEDEEGGIEKGIVDNLTSAFMQKMMGGPIPAAPKIDVAELAASLSPAQLKEAKEVLGL